MEALKGNGFVTNDDDGCDKIINFLFLLLANKMLYSYEYKFMKYDTVVI